MKFLRKVEKNEGEVLVFIGRVHGRRSGTSIQDTDQSTSDTCHRLKCFCSLSDPHSHDGVAIRRPLSKGPHHQHPLSSDRHLSNSVFNHSVLMITVPVLCYRSFTPVRHPHKYGPSLLFVLTVTPIDRLHDGDGSNGVKGAAEEDKM